MKQFLKHIRWALALVLLLPACSKGDFEVDVQRTADRYGQTSQEAGVAIGMATQVSSHFSAIAPQLAAQVNTIVLAGVLIFELVGPIITKFALTKAGEIAPVK